MKWYDDSLNYGASPPNAHAWLYHPKIGLAVSPLGGVHIQALQGLSYPYNQPIGPQWTGLTTQPAYGRVYPKGSIGGTQGPYGVVYKREPQSPHVEEAKQAVEDWLMNQQQIKTASLPYKFVWADGQMAVGPGWKKNVHHMHLMQQLGVTKMPENMYAGTYHEDPFTGTPSITPDWEAYGNTPSEEELMEQIRQILQQPEHPGRVARKPW